MRKLWQASNVKMEITYAKGGLLLMFECRKLWTLKPKLCTNLDFDKQLCYCT